MATINHAPIQQALNRVRQLSADEEAQRLAFVRERAMRDEVSYLSEARQEGHQEGLQEGLQKGIETGQHNALATTLLQLLTLKFGTPPEVVQARVQQANAETLHGWIAQVLTAETVDQVFKAVDCHN